MNAWALITCLYLVIVLPSFMKWLQIRAVKWIHLHLFYCIYPRKSLCKKTSSFAVWACFHHSFNFHLSHWKWETVWKGSRSLREVLPFGRFMSPTVPWVKCCLWRTQPATSPLGIHRELQPPSPVARRFSPAGNAGYNELALSGIKNSLFRNRREVQMLLSWHGETLRSGISSGAFHCLL